MVTRERSGEGAGKQMSKDAREVMLTTMRNGILLRIPFLPIRAGQRGRESDS
jgi:hypothetical protein